MVQTYYALRQAVGTAAQQPLKSQFLSFAVGTRQACGLPPVQPGRDQSGVPLPRVAADCVAAAYDRQRAAWASRLSGPAAEEAARAPERNTELQSRLKALGLLPRDAVADGVFGTATRTAVAFWQRRAGRPETSFLGDADAAILLGTAVAASPPPDPLADLRDPPLAEASYLGEPSTIEHRELRVTLAKGKSFDPKICQDRDGGVLKLGAVAPGHAGECETVSVRLSVGGGAPLTTLITVTDDPDHIDMLHIKVAIRRLDPATQLPQVVVSGYTGGAHCCTLSAVLTPTAEGTWQVVDLGGLDGSEGYDFLRLVDDGTVEMASVDNAFLYRFASYAGSFAPTRVRRLLGGKVQDTTGDPRHHGFLLRQLREIEGGRDDGMRAEPNGYLAGWVAQKALVGQLEDAWRAMLTLYDRKATDGLSSCGVDERVWVASPGGSIRECPDGQEVAAPFPEVLALFMVERGYMTPAQAGNLGYDPATIGARRRVAMAAATAHYEQQIAHAWYVLTRTGACARAESPASPAELIKADRLVGVEDSINVLSADGDGKPVVVLVGKPRSNGLTETMTFYRGLTRCDTSRREQQHQLEELK